MPQGALPDVADRFIGNPVYEIFIPPSRCLCAGNPTFAGLQPLGRLHGYPLVLNKCMGRETGYFLSEIIIESPFGRPVFYWGTVVRVLSLVFQRSRKPIPRRPVEAQMPFPDAGGMVTRRLKHGPDGIPDAVDHRALPDPGDALFPVGAPTVPAGQQAVTRRCADRSRGIGVGKGKPLGGKPVDMRRGNG